MKVLREILRLRKQDKDERDEQGVPARPVLRAMESAAHRRQKQHSAKPATKTPAAAKLGLTALQIDLR